ncbi:MAG: nuclear transport factor 2 family protein [Acidobacteria bacterium]|nr:nuclear transport factor 2 family protein [Acidobacteriota bacterium]
MIRTGKYLLAAAIAFAFIGCNGTAVDNKPVANANAATSNANVNAAKTTAAAPTKDALMALEKGGWEGWKNRDPKWTEENVSDKYVGFGSAGRIDKAASIKSFTEQKCEIKSYTLSDDQMQMVGPDVAILTFKASQDYTCDGKKGPENVNSTSMYVREGDKWKTVFYGETAVIDPKAPAKPAKKEEAKTDEAKPDAATEPLLAIESKLWEGWKNKDPKLLEDTFGKNFNFYTGAGRTDRAATIKQWATDNKCEVKSFSLHDAKSVSLTKDVSLLTYKGGGDGTCEGQPIMTEWYATAFLKEGETWHPAFGMSVAP